MMLGIELIKMISDDYLQKHLHPTVIKRQDIYGRSRCVKAKQRGKTKGS